MCVMNTSISVKITYLSENLRKSIFVRIKKLRAVFFYMFALEFFLKFLFALFRCKIYVCGLHTVHIGIIFVVGVSYLLETV